VEEADKVKRELAQIDPSRAGRTVADYVAPVLARELEAAERIEDAIAGYQSAMHDNVILVATDLRLVWAKRELF
jgi:hypothetical protein